tara:strand:+ start:1246 stop:1488 length:243 start_codon:yes stop_codon:yes gene_type:complete
MRIEMLRSTIVDLNQVNKGDFVETSESTARLLIGMNKAKEAPLLQNVVITSEPDVEKTSAKKKTTPKRKPKANGNSQPGV